MELTYDKINLLAYIQKSWLVILRLKNMIERRKTNRPISNRIFVSCLRLFNRQWWSVFISKLRQRTQRSKPKKDLDRYNKKQKTTQCIFYLKISQTFIISFGYLFNSKWPKICFMKGNFVFTKWNFVFMWIKNEWFFST